MRLFGRCSWPLTAMATAAELDRGHAECLGRHDVVVDAIAHHDTGTRRDAERFGGCEESLRIGLAQTGQSAETLVVEQIADSGARQSLAGSLVLVGNDAKLQ